MTIINGPIRIDLRHQPDPQPDARIPVKIARLDPNARLPTYATDGSAGLDLRALDSALIMPGQAMTFDTGIALQPPPGYVTFIYARSGLSFKHGVRLANGVAVIDSDFRGSILVRLRNDGSHPYEVKRGERVAQAVLQLVQRVRLEEVESLEATARGAGGIGSTGTT